MHQALPVMGGMASQNVLNLADSVMVGRLGTACVASVGIASTLNFVCQAALQGISSGVQAMSARRIGEGRPEIAAVPLNAALVACVMFGVPMAVGAYVLAPSIVPRLTSDAAVIAFAVPYLKARLIAVPAVGVNFAFRGFWNAVQQPQIYMNTLLVMHFVNVTLSLLLIFGCVVDVPLVGQIVIPKLGVLGAGVGTTVSVYVGMVMYLKMGFTKAKEMGFASAKPSGDDLKTLLSQAAPTSITNLLFATGMTCMYWIVGKLGTAETAAVNVLINLMLTLVLPCMGMGLAAGALSGRALGRGTYLGLSQIRHALFLPPLRDVNYSLKGSILHTSQVHRFTEAGDCSDQLP
jgi:MATE family multidrug resistance protein